MNNMRIRFLTYDHFIIIILEKFDNSTFCTFARDVKCQLVDSINGNCKFRPMKTIPNINFNFIKTDIARSIKCSSSSGFKNYFCIQVLQCQKIMWKNWFGTFLFLTLTSVFMFFTFVLLSKAMVFMTVISVLTGLIAWLTMDFTNFSCQKWNILVQ